MIVLSQIVTCATICLFFKIKYFHNSRFKMFGFRKSWSSSSANNVARLGTKENVPSGLSSIEDG